MSELERHLSEITENENFGKVDTRYSSPSEVLFAGLQALGMVHGGLSYSCRGGHSSVRSFQFCGVPGTSRAVGGMVC
jgi:hypothetical protein